MPFMPPDVFSARSSTPASHPCAHLNDAKRATSCSDRSRTSHPPADSFGVPTSSPLSARQGAGPTTCQPARVAVLDVTSGLKDGPAVLSGMDRTATDQSATSAGMRVRAIADLTCEGYIIQG